VDSAGDYQIKEEKRHLPSIGHMVENSKQSSSLNKDGSDGHLGFDRYYEAYQGEVEYKEVF
jgi:hypothetical protein